MLVTMRSGINVDLNLRPLDVFASMPSSLDGSIGRASVWQSEGSWFKSRSRNWIYFSFLDHHAGKIKLLSELSTPCTKSNFDFKLVLVLPKYALILTFLQCEPFLCCLFLWFQLFIFDVFALINFIAELLYCTGSHRVSPGDVSIVGVKKLDLEVFRNIDRSKLVEST